MAEYKVTTLTYNTTMVTEPYINVYFIGPLGDLVWLPPLIIIICFFIFFTYSFIEFHAVNKERYVTRRNQVMVENNTRAQLTSSFSEYTLNDMFPKRRLRPFALKMDLEKVLRDIWLCHGANPRKLQALFLQMQVKMLSAGRLEADGEPAKAVTSMELANPGMLVGQFTAGSVPSGLITRSRRGSSTSNGGSEGSSDSLFRDRASPRRHSIRQLPATPQLTSQRTRPILQKASSLTSNLTRTPSYNNHNVSFQLNNHTASSCTPGSTVPAIPPLPSAFTQSNIQHLSASQALMRLRQMNYTNPSLLQRDNTIDMDCDNDFITEGGGSHRASVGQGVEKKGNVNVLMMQKYYKKN